MLVIAGALLAPAAAGEAPSGLIFFHSQNCPPCRQMEPVVRQLAAAGEPIFWVDVDARPDLRDAWGVTRWPTFISIDRRQEVEREIGVVPLTRLRQMLARIRQIREPPPDPVATAPTVIEVGRQAPALPPEWMGDTPSRLPPPDYVSVPKVREAASSSQIAADVACRISRSYGGDPSLAAHEDTHQVNAQIANAHGGSRVMGLYVYNGYGVVIPQPPLTLSRVASAIPESWRGSTYLLYLVKQQRPPAGAGPNVIGHENSPLYVLDEWCAYARGLAAGLETGTAATSDVLQSLEFLGYALALSHLVATEAFEYDATQLDRYICRQAGWTIWLYKQAENKYPALVTTEVQRYLSLMRAAPDAEAIRAHARRVYGEAWVQATLGF